MRASIFTLWYNIVMERKAYFTKLKQCRLCPRLCGVDRLSGRQGFCGTAGEDAEIARAALHMWEEPCISGTRGSGTVFFNHCNLKCVYCQNQAISRSSTRGIRVSPERLSEIFLELQVQGAHNINLVTPTHYACQIALAVDLSRKSGLGLPVIYNCGGYEEADTINFLGDRVQIYLTDFKYWDRLLSREYSQAPNYRARAIKALDVMVQCAGDPILDKDGILQRGVIVRHLVLPGAWEDSIKIIGFLHKRYGERIYISVMNQYTPPTGCILPDKLRQPLCHEEYERVLQYAEEIGVENGFMQYGGTVSESFIPDFDGHGVLKRNDFMV